ncbi:MAG: T9SS type A sorting domain-containing protein [Flavobacteriales bacterium]
MKKLIFCFFLLVSFQLVNAQCEGCIINTNCSANPPGPTLCPEVLPQGTQGEFYDADITFYLPNQFFEPSAGVTVTVSQLIISSVSGLPLGVTWQSSSPNNTYQITSNENTHRGCVKICGIPTFAGNFVISVNVAVSVSAPISTISNQTFTLPLTINPGAGGNSGFTFNPASGCDSVSTSFQGIITDDFRPVSYTWQINGTESLSGQNVEYMFNQPDSHQVVLTTTLFNYVLTSLTVTATTNQWCGDIEEPNIFGCIGAPDLFFRLTNDGVTVQSPTINNQLTANFTNLSYVITTPAISISFWDEDLGPPLGSPDDFLGTAVITINGTGSYNFSTPHTVGSFTIGTQVFVTQSDTDYVVVHASPEPPLKNWTGMPATEFCAGEPIVFQADTAFFMQWYRDGIPVINANSTTFIVNNNNEISLEIGDENGCSSFSDPVNISFNPVPPVPSVFYNSGSNTLFTNIVPGFDLQWYFEENPIAGATGTTHNPQQDGSYSLLVSNEFGCTNISQPYVHSTVGVNNISKAQFSLYPNPAKDQIFIQSNQTLHRILHVFIIDVQGRILFNEKIVLNEQGNLSVDLHDFIPGLYHIQLLDEQKMIFNHRFVKM